MSFSGNVVLVTGASSGIGAATAILFSKEGASVAIVGRNEEKLGNVAQKCAQAGAQPLVIRADVSNEEEASTIVKKTVDRFGKLDVLVNNAGIVRMVPVADPNILKVFDEVMNTNLRSIVQLTSLAVPFLKETKGNIVNVSSIASTKVVAESCMPYCVSKAGVDHFTRCAALELAESGVRVNSVNPGPVRTDICENAGMVPPGAGDVTWEQAKVMTALNRVGEPEEIADVIAFLASDKARSITGSAYVSDNGQLLK
ncbi:3-oxoacyl-[acyl-carrier-protein] reductase FabG-like [Leguminivora glycinivorella]|uniref:3-oxoacyl-[acyl-carrier-protein] reductase FabG-like n=1 Tax=Leguminivora glycinivorella TaxID=1035111 RepID=UPI00200EE119|nr:3-oxoacyl-[acyl-carrier-protein] reductase FabG-like [Leguminivora glycinivorella]